MKKYITIAGTIIMASLFVLPMMAFGRSGRTGNHPGKMMWVTAPQTELQTPTLTVEGISRIEALQERLQDENANTLKQLMVTAQNEIMADIREEIQAQPPALTAEKISRIEALQERFRDENANTLKQLMTEAQNEIKADIQEEINDLNAKLTRTKIDLYAETFKVNPNA